MPGSLVQLGADTNPVMRAVVVVPVRLFTNHAGFGEMANSPCSSERGEGRNGPRATVLSGPASSRGLGTTPIPLCTSFRVCPGNAPQGMVGTRKPSAVQVFTAMQ